MAGIDRRNVLRVPGSGRGRSGSLKLPRALYLARNRQIGQACACRVRALSPVTPPPTNEAPRIDPAEADAAWGRWKRGWRSGITAVTCNITASETPDAARRTEVPMTSLRESVSNT